MVDIEKSWDYFCLFTALLHCRYCYSTQKGYDCYIFFSFISPDIKLAKNYGPQIFICTEQPAVRIDTIDATAQQLY
jgi:hypothetical protein